MDIKDVLRRQQFHFNKQFGQNFITDTNLLNAIACDAEITPHDTVVEIGTGAGTLTRALSAAASHVITFEIDKNLVPVLSETLSDLQNVTLVMRDFMRVSDEELRALTGGEFKVVANLPYYITTPIIMRLLEDFTDCKSITIMLQREVADRLTATPSTEDFGAITLAVQARADVTVTRQVSRRMFFPVPNVDSTVIRIDRRPDKYPQFDSAALKLIKCAFLMRRKTLVNNIINVYPITREETERILQSLGYDVRLRGETLDVADYIAISRLLPTI